MSCKVFSKQRWLKLHQNGFQGPVYSCGGQRNCSLQNHNSGSRIQNPCCSQWTVWCSQKMFGREGCAKGTVPIIPGWSFSSKIGGGGELEGSWRWSGIWNFLKWWLWCLVLFFFLVLLLMSLFECKVPNKRSRLPLDCIYCSWWLQLCVNIRKQRGPAFQESLEQCHEDKCPDWYCSHTPRLSCCF